MLAAAPTAFLHIYIRERPITAIEAAGGYAASTCHGCHIEGDAQMVVSSSIAVQWGLTRALKIIMHFNIEFKIEKVQCLFSDL